MIIRTGLRADAVHMYKLLQQEWKMDEDMHDEMKLHQFDHCLSNSSIFLVAEEDNKIIGMLMLHFQHKLIRSGSRAAFIEEVIVDKNNRGRGIGERLVKHACNTARLQGCYKVTLSCFENRIAFYERCGFNNESQSMRLNLK
jgi:GNAT superfamily N-acetyltransferase